MTIDIYFPIPPKLADFLIPASGVNGKVRRIRQMFGQSPNPRTVKNWYEGHCSPNLTHFIRLVRLSPKLLESFLVVCGYEDVARGLAEQNNDQYRTWDGQNVACYCINFDTKNTFLSGNSLRQLKQRQLWFYAEVQLGHKPTARSLTEFWSISIATARRDIAVLSL